MRVPSADEAKLRELLLERFHAMGFHPRLLSHLVGVDADEQWDSLHRLVMDPETDPADVLKGAWAPFWHEDDEG